ncbi:hypothetical protein, partial [Candidatus Burkholderia verschuerenii]|uniref:hypothetical protein n=1 Tax=Candidatus Burkholderia verschuerenii TaxID=242163 RepID=UPI000A6955B6
ACLASHNLNFPNRPVRTRTPGGVAGWCGRGPASLLAAPMPIIGAPKSRIERIQDLTVTGRAGRGKI